VRSDRHTRNPVVAAVAAVWNYLPTLALGIVGAWVVLYLLSLVDWFGLG
jgi:hypothetical protein